MNAKSKVSLSDIETAKEQAKRYIGNVKGARTTGEIIDIIHEARHLRSFEDDSLLWHFYTEVIITAQEEVRLRQRMSKDINGLLEFAKTQLK